MENKENKFYSSSVGEDIYELFGTMEKIKHIASNFDSRYKLDEEIKEAVPQWEAEETRASMSNEIWILKDYVYEAYEMVDKLVDIPIVKCAKGVAV